MTSVVLHIPPAFDVPREPSSWSDALERYSFSDERRVLSEGGSLGLVVDIVVPGARPGLDSAHEAGKFYCMDLSSALMASALGACARFPSRDGAMTREAPELILDLCAAPGGKSIAAWALFGGRVTVVANEVIGKRIPSLISNFKRCHIAPAGVTCRDPSYFAKEWPQSFPLVIVDAPCSGQSLVASRGGHTGAYHPVTINRNVGRQRRIVSQAVAAVAPSGYLAYMTCTFSPAENAGIVSWLLKKFPFFEAIPVPHLEPYRQSDAPFPCYLFTPENGGGAGGFVALLRRTNEGANCSPMPVTFDALPLAWRNDGESAAHKV